MTEPAWIAEERLLKQARDAMLPFEPCLTVAECYQCGQGIEADEYAYSYDGHWFCNEDVCIDDYLLTEEKQMQGEIEEVSGWEI